MAPENKPSRYLEYLPAIYQEDPFLGQFLRPFEEVLTNFDNLLSVIDRYFNPTLTPTHQETNQDFLRWLAGWVALELDENWDETKKRRLVGEAVKLYRHLGTVEGLKRYLEIYQERVVPDIREGCWPGGMQLGVASQIAGLTPDDASLSRIESADRREPPIVYDYYIIDTVAPANHPQVAQGQFLRLYYRADQVKRVSTGGKAETAFVRLQLQDNRTRLYRPASVIRCDGLIDERYKLTLEGEMKSDTAFFKGDTYLINEVELPYRFTINIRVPLEDWEYLCSFQVEPHDDLTLKDFWQQKLRDYRLPLAGDISLSMDKPGRRWWKIYDHGQQNGDKVHQYLAVRKGIRFDVYTWVGRQDWEKARQLINIQSIKGIIDEVRPAHTMYYLQLTPKISQDDLQPMQLGVHSTVEVDTSIG